MGESLLLTSVAGFAGLAAGVGLLQLVDMMLQSVPSETMFFRSPQISFGTAMAATAVLLIAGMLAGMLPAWRALQIKAIDAIREE